MDIEQLEQRKTELLARRKELITAINELKYTTPELTPDENDELEEQSLRSGAEAYMKYDPDTAYSWLQQAEDLKVKRDNKTKEKDPETIRFKLASNLNALNARISAAKADDPTLDGMRELARSIQKQISADVPSLQAAYILLNESDKVLDENTEVDDDSEVGGVQKLQGNLPEGVRAVRGQPVINDKVSDTPTDWYYLVEEDGARKPYIYNGLDAQNMPDNVEKKYNDAMLNWNRNNKTAKNAAGDAEAKKKGIEIAKNLATGIPATVDKLASIATQLRSLIDKFNKGDYNLANFANLKSTMADGRMTDSDVGLALGLKTTEGFIQNVKSWATGGKAGVGALDDKESARTAINMTIDEYNKTMGNMLKPAFTGKYSEYAKKAWEDNSYSTRFAHLPSSFEKLSGGGGGTKPPVAEKPKPTSGKTSKSTWKVVPSGTLEGQGT